MKLQFLGAVRQVTGSQYCLQTAGLKALVDCGMFQEREQLSRNWHPFCFHARDIDVVLLTHAHIDHCGLLPKLVRDGFRGRILATAPTIELVEVLLRDSAEIQAEDIRYKKKRHGVEGRQGRYPEQPLYTMVDVERTLPMLESVTYHQPAPLGRNSAATFYDAGHILGSAMIEVAAEENGKSLKLFFSGDLGQPNRPFVRRADTIHEADVLVVESTYGDRTHDVRLSLEDQLVAEIEPTIAAGGKVIIPVFAVERAQEVIYHLGKLIRAGRLPAVPAYLDSPMAAEVTRIFHRYQQWFDPAAQREASATGSLLDFRSLTTTRTVEESKRINRERGPAIIMAANGMCSAGRIKHHLAQYIDKPEHKILFVGYQAQGTLGRQIVDGRKEVRLLGRQRLVRAQIARIEGFSGHADKTALLEWLSHIRTAPAQTYLTHGEEAASLALAEEIRSRFGWNVSVPTLQQTIEF